MTIEASAEVIDTQERLARALLRARASEDRELAIRVRERGEMYVRQMTGLLRMTRFHDLMNHAFDEPLRDTTASLKQMISWLGPVQLIFVDELVYLNDLRVRFSAENDAGGECCRIFARHDVGGVTFHAPLSEMQWRVFVRLVMSDPPTDRAARAVLRESMSVEGLNSVELHPPFRLRLRGEEDAASNVSQSDVVEHAATAVSGLWDQIALGRLVNPVKVRRAANEMVDMPREGLDKTLVEGVAADENKPYVRHSLTVAALSLVIGRGSGLTNELLADLAISACFHDLGYGVDEDGVAPPFERHGTAALRRLLDERGFHDARVRRLRVCLEHHRPFNFTRKPSVFARIVHVADDYDTLTRPRGRRAFVSPPEALGRMKAASGTEYDPVFLQLFINHVGKYPPGTRLLLEDGSWVLVISTARNPATFERPVTRLIRTPHGAVPDEDFIIDLAESRHTVLRTLA